MANSVIVPAINQVELHPGFQQPEVRAANAAAGIATEAWSPLGRGRYSDAPILQAIAHKHSKTVSQVILRWHLQIGNLVIPKSSNPDRLKENFDVFDFKLEEIDLNEIATLDVANRTGLNPDDFG
jgi:2,5-diketo-D-gluconate reductase A